MHTHLWQLLSFYRRLQYFFIWPKQESETILVKGGVNPSWHPQKINLVDNDFCGMDFQNSSFSWWYTTSFWRYAYPNLYCNISTYSHTHHTDDKHPHLNTNGNPHFLLPPTPPNTTRRMEDSNWLGKADLTLHSHPQLWTIPNETSLLILKERLYGRKTFSHRKIIHR